MKNMQELTNAELNLLKTLQDDIFKPYLAKMKIEVAQEIKRAMLEREEIKEARKRFPEREKEFDEDLNNFAKENAKELMREPGEIWQQIEKFKQEQFDIVVKRMSAKR